MVKTWRIYEKDVGVVGWITTAKGLYFLCTRDQRMTNLDIVCAGCDLDELAEAGGGGSKQRKFMKFHEGFTMLLPAPVHPMTL